MHIIQSAHAPAAIGPYSQAMQVGHFLFTSGQIPLRPDGSLEEGDIVAQTQQVFANLKAVLATAGLDFSNVIKTTVFLKDLNDFSPMNEVYAQVFGEHKPARSTVQVAKLPRDARVEIELIASLGA